MRPCVRHAGLWMWRLWAVGRGLLPLHPGLVVAALARAVLDVAEELLTERGLPYSSRAASFIFTGRAADQSGLARRTILELFVEAAVKKVFHPEDGEAWILQEAEKALADAGWVWVSGQPKRRPKVGVVSQPIQLVGGRPYGAPSPPSFEARVEAEERWLRVFAGSLRVLETGKICRRVLEDGVAEGLVAPSVRRVHYFAPYMLRRQGRKAKRGSVVAGDWQARLLAVEDGWEKLTLPPLWERNSQDGLLECGGWGL